MLSAGKKSAPKPVLTMCKAFPALFFSLSCLFSGSYTASGATPADFAEVLRVLPSSESLVLRGTDHWLFLTSELRFLSIKRFWGPEAPAASRAQRPDWADPLPAIVDFQRQLKERGIALLLVPVPPKAALYPDKLPATASPLPAPENPIAPSLSEFYSALNAEGVEVLDLAPLFLRHRSSNRGSVYCATDSHWSGNGCVLAAQAIAERVRHLVPAQIQNPFISKWESASVHGDLGDLPGAQTAPSPDESLSLRQISGQDGAEVAPDSNSPLLLLGDSHTLVFHEFLGERAGLLDQLAFELGQAPDLIGTRGSGASPVRISLLRKSVKDPTYLAKKKIVVWCFTSREFTDADSGWQKIAVSR
jgi:hypothetical protein